jgi:hypothetical protein
MIRKRDRLYKKLLKKKVVTSREIEKQTACGRKTSKDQKGIICSPVPIGRTRKTHFR